jgi:hypothetical protein
VRACEELKPPDKLSRCRISGDIMRHWAFVAAGLSSTFVFGSSFAASAPPQLVGKSVSLSWTDARVERRESGQELSISQTSNVKIYVSDKGRVFSKFNRSAVWQGGRGQSREDLDISGSGGHTLNFHSEGNALVIDQISTGGARRLTVKFDKDFAACSIDVIHGKSGQRTRHRNLENSAWLELVSIKVTATSCSVSNGNVFGQ